ncbi:alpha/beta fold hydrolase [Plastoroseomonas hellenica]|uniref:alpha/beta fold hydrolase n=1 Tax=Plastoroseomonas hellenica TaxID=2687306 RepID=UPI001BA6F315|nr:alpha/beta hydrolase [Plastoroseomonas hellenica]MBR0646831.1 alpha/beta fold hydrolase [Plastoroseomonas hellenica]
MPDLLHHRLHGDAARPPALLLIHPLGATLDLWNGCLPAWTQRFTCLALDLRSAGASPPGKAPGLDRHVEDLETLRIALGIDAIVPIGCAMGGMVAAAYAARHPERVSALVISNPTPRSSEAGRAMLTARAEAVRAGGMAAILPAAVERPFEAQPRDARYDRYLDAFAAQDAEAYAEAVLGFASADASADLARVRCPVLLVAGRHDLLLPLEQAEATRALLPPGARLEIDEEGAHFLPYQCPEAFAARVLSFLPQAASHTRTLENGR